MCDIVVLGAGAVGLSTAVNILSYVPDRHVVIIADKFTTETTSDGAAGIIGYSDTSVAKSLPQYKKWLMDSFKWYHDLFYEYDPSVTGIQRLSGYQLNETEREPAFHHDICYNFRDLTEKELQSFPGNHKFGWMYTTLMVEGRKYLPWLTKRFLSNGGRIVKKTVTNISEFAGNCSVLVNCSGLGSGKLFNDRDVYPVRGHVLRVKAPWVKHFMVTEDAYIYPGQDTVVLGGTRQKGEYDTSVTGPWFEAILDRCERLQPGIKNAEIVDKWVGLRPFTAKQLRVEQESINVNGTQLQVVHNYGHGANGVALSWGTSLEAAQIVRDIIRSQKVNSSKL